MADVTGRPSPRLEPVLAWTAMTDAPLKGLLMAREAGVLLAWDSADQLYLLDGRGERTATVRAPGPIAAGAISDDGTLLALVGRGDRLWLIGPDLEIQVERSTLAEVAAVAVDPHGRYVAVASKLGPTQFYTRHGRPAGRFVPRQPLGHLKFVADQPILVGTAAHGTIVAAELAPADDDPDGYRLQVEPLWQQSLLSNVGRLALTGDGGMILASCYSHGVQRFDLRGQAEGSYHLGGSASHAVPDFAGRIMAVATLEGELAIMNRGGNLRWKTALPRPAVALEVDALGRFLVFGQETGEIARLDLEPSTGATPSAPKRPAAVAVGEPARAVGVRTPAWTVPVAASDEQAETLVLAVLDSPTRVAVVDNRNRLRVFTDAGEPLGQAPEIAGGGRFLRTAPGWIAAATDKNILLYNAADNTARRLDLDLVQITHLALRPDGYGLGVVQERDRVGRATTAGRWVWRLELDSPVEDLAIGPEATTGVTTDDGRLRIFDAGGQPAGGYTAQPTEPLCLVEAPTGSPSAVAWLTLARRHQVLRGHDKAGRVIWEAPVPWEAWQLIGIGPLVVAVAPDGRALAYDGSGNPRAPSRGGAPPGQFAAGPDGLARRVVREGVHLICTDLTGKVHWRAVAEPDRGPFAVGRSGVAAMLGRALAWFPVAIS